MRDAPDPRGDEVYLDRIHDDDEPDPDERLAELHEDRVDIELRLARDIASHSDTSTSAMEIVERADGDGDALLATFRGLYAPWRDDVDEEAVLDV